MIAKVRSGFAVRQAAAQVQSSLLGTQPGSEVSEA